MTKLIIKRQDSGEDIFLIDKDNITIGKDDSERGMLSPNPDIEIT